MSFFLRPSGFGIFSPDVREVLAFVPTACALVFDVAKRVETANPDCGSHISGLLAGLAVHLFTRPTEPDTGFEGDRQAEREYRSTVYSLASGALTGYFMQATEGRPLAGLVTGMLGGAFAYKTAIYICNSQPNLEPEPPTDQAEKA